MRNDKPLTTVLFPFFLAFAISIIHFLLQGNVRLDWADEGFLWYGVIHARLGEVPIRDFQSYDPGRYYWGAAFSYLFGTGLMATRLAASLFQGLCLSFGLLAVSRVVKNKLSLLGVGLLAMAWMFWNFRYYDSGMALVAVFFGVRLVERFEPRRAFQAGAATALIAFVGLNHGFYALCAFSALLFFCFFKKLSQVPVPRMIVSFAAGYAAGLLPLAALFLAYPGFFQIYAERFIFLFGSLFESTTNLPRALPWPWTVPWHELDPQSPKFGLQLFYLSNSLAQGMAFLTMIAAYPVLAFALLKKTKGGILNNPLLASSFFVGVFYFHQIFSRADITHLGESFFPLVAAAAASSRLFMGWLAIVTLTAALPLSNLFFWGMVPKDRMTSYAVGGDKIWLFNHEAAQMDGIKRTLKAYVEPGESVFLAPLLTTFYGILEMRSPAYEIYFLLPSPASHEERDLRDLESKKVRWALVADLSVDGQRSRSISQTRPRLWEYLQTHFENVTQEGLPPGYFLMRRRDA